MNRTDLVEVKLAIPGQPGHIEDQKLLLEILKKYQITPIVSGSKILIKEKEFWSMTYNIQHRYGCVIRRILPDNHPRRHRE